MVILFKIEKLRELASFALDSTNYRPPDSARVRPIPDVRTIRYYTTIGLIDRPAEMQGRTALYGLRHVEQLVAIKRLQAENLTLSDIQHRMIGMPSKELKELASLPPDIEQKFSASHLTPADRAVPTKAEPSPAPSVGTPQASADLSAGPSDELWKRVPQSRRSPVSAQDSEEQRVNHIVRLPISVGVSIEITLNAPTAVNFDLAGIAKSAQPLLQELQRQQIISNRQS